MRRELPSGTVTFLFTDVEGSTRLLHELGAQGYAQALAEHRRVIRAACAAQGGLEVDTQGDAFFFAFRRAHPALAGRGGVGHRGAQPRADPGESWPAPGTPQRGRGRLRGRGRAQNRPYRGFRARWADPRLPIDCFPCRDVELRDLGEHRFKDSVPPSASTNSVVAIFLPSRVLYRTNLPVPATPFLGRERELAQVVELGYCARTSACSPFTGPGGTGKTRLAAQAAAEAAEAFPDGITWVPLASQRDPALRSYRPSPRRSMREGKTQAWTWSRRSAMCSPGGTHSSCSTTSSIFCPLRRREIAALGSIIGGRRSSSRAESGFSFRVSRCTPCLPSTSQTVCRSSSPRARALDRGFPS